MAEQKKDSIHKRIRYKYRISIIDEETWNERGHLKLSLWSLIVLLATLFLLSMLLFSLVILYTPIRQYLPGYSENIRQQLVEESVRVDSLVTSMQVQGRYLDVIKQVVAGEADLDTVQRLDSMEIIMRAQLLEAKSEATETFVTQYEEQERDNLTLFDRPGSRPTLTFYRPVEGVVIKTFMPAAKQYATVIRTNKHTPVCATLNGIVVYVEHELDNTYTMMVQHEGYLSVYRHIGQPTKGVGSEVKAAECIAFSADEYDLEFALWKEGKVINPETVIAF